MSSSVYACDDPAQARPPIDASPPSDKQNRERQRPERIDDRWREPVIQSAASCPGMTEKDRLKQHLRFQAAWCRRLGSPQYATLLEQTEQDVDANGPCWRVLEGHGPDPLGSVPTLRFLGALHRLVLVVNAQL